MPLALVSIKQYWELAHTLGGNAFFGRARLFFLLLSVPFRKKLFGRVPRRLPLVVGGRTYPFFVRDAADFSVLYELFIGREYEVTLEHEPAYIIDIGSHIGASVLFFRTRYPSASINAYEPDPDNFALLKQNVGLLSNVTCTQAAVAAGSGTVTFYKNNDSSIRSSLFNRGGRQEPIQVEALSLADVVSGREVDLIKFDVEGAEVGMFADQTPLAQVKALVGEVHHRLINQTSEQFGGLFNGLTLEVRHAGAEHSIVFLRRQ